MIEYLINVALGMAAPTVAVILTLITGLIFRKPLRKFLGECYKWYYRGAIAFWVAMFVIAATSPSITYKHEPFDKLQEQNNIELINKNESDETVKIKDLSKPIVPNNKEDFEKLVDYSK